MFFTKIYPLLSSGGSELRGTVCLDLWGFSQTLLKCARSPDAWQLEALWFCLHQFWFETDNTSHKGTQKLNHVSSRQFLGTEGNLAQISACTQQACWKELWYHLAVFSFSSTLFWLGSAMKLSLDSDRAQWSPVWVGKMKQQKPHLLPAMVVGSCSSKANTAANMQAPTPHQTCCQGCGDTWERHFLPHFHHLYLISESNLQKITGCCW